MCTFYMIVLIYNKGNRVEDFLFEKIEKKRPNRLSNLEYMGQDMIDAGNEFGPGTAYGNFSHINLFLTLTHLFRIFIIINCFRVNMAR